MEATKTRESVVVASKIRDAIRDLGCQTSGDLPEALSERIHQMLTQAVERAKSNGRATVRPHDL